MASGTRAILSLLTGPMGSSQNTMDVSGLGAAGGGSVGGEAYR
jgi:hypothetical protein